MKASYDAMRYGLRMLRSHFAVLSGDEMRPSQSSWQDVAADCAATLRQLADLLDAARDGKAEPFLVFPSLNDLDGEADA